ncbi:MAG: hypothetical protein QOI15_1920 [Pseudonocardiales bacterium]|jgi:hypothetical protein|nr:hypothetical protein [Pseudonocardiales bacterium]MDT4921018.1 hypothetical protein [Pseudonocardiales bacterium]MDT4942342.1 hypothetical protein [Pseudonocardiales bacterium]
MEIVGIIATSLAALVVLTVIVMLLVSLPDIRRYLKIRSM